MADEETQSARAEGGEGFEPIASYERLIALRDTSPDAFMLQTSEATRRALVYYERAKERAGGRA